MREKGRWADWAAIAAGLALGVSWMWHGMYGWGGGLMFVLGLVVIMAAVISLNRPAAVSGEIALMAIGLLTFALPWILGFTEQTAAAWSAWLIGPAIMLLGLYGLVMAGRTRKRDPELAWTIHRNEFGGRPSGRVSSP
ncbi:SPW repeat protein [Nocardiopsis sp. EMB25]|uniref:SPW repeat protein n=1 Tax=Nocardiopsis sp. EMB25 TaxID=2835867 RepID=UPI002284C4FC|nr:SPW repeat protein [Nocardiopsis sp. EMB25]MCY9785640.1 SPW repeat protein [Nocardiopsis sp. EMB25]